MQNYNSALSFIIATIILISFSCKNETINPAIPLNSRKIQYSLFTEKDFSAYNHNITFTFLIRDLRGKHLWDSVLAPMKVKDIPSIKQKIFFEKNIPNGVKSKLEIGITYRIENVGISWKVDTLNEGTMLKKMELNFF